MNSNTQAIANSIRRVLPHRDGQVLAAIIEEGIAGEGLDSHVAAAFESAQRVQKTAESIHVEPKNLTVYSLDDDPQDIRFRTAEACRLALAMGAQGNPPPPAEHWLMPFWEMGREHARAVLATFAPPRAAEDARNTGAAVVLTDAEIDSLLRPSWERALAMGKTGYRVYARALEAQVIAKLQAQSAGHAGGGEADAQMHAHVDAERERCCRIVYGQCGSDNVAQRTVDAIRGGAES